MARLTIPDEQTFAEFTVVTSTSAFPITFSLFAKADLTVLIDDVALTQSDFSFSGTVLDGGGYDGGTVTLNTAVDDVTVRIERNIAPARTSNFAPAGTTPVGSVDQALNRLTAVQQDHKRRIESVETTVEDVADDAAAAEAAAVRAEAAEDATRAIFDVAGEVQSSASVTYLPAGTGAVVMSAQDVLRTLPVFPAAFGLFTDATVTTATMKRAFDFAIANKRPIVLSGIYYVNGPIATPSTVADGALDLRFDGDVRIVVDAASTPIDFLISAFSTAATVHCIGQTGGTLEIYGNDKVARAVTLVSNTGGATPSGGCFVRGLRINDVATVAATGTAAYALDVVGPYAAYSFDDILVDGVSRHADLNATGDCKGLRVSQARVPVKVTNSAFRRVLNALQDADGAYVVGEIESSLPVAPLATFENCEFEDCQGRSMKTGARHTEVFNCRVIRQQVVMIAQGHDVDPQYGSVDIDDLTLKYRRSVYSASPPVTAGVSPFSAVGGVFRPIIAQELYGDGPKRTNIRNVRCTTEVAFDGMIYAKGAAASPNREFTVDGVVVHAVGALTTTALTRGFVEFSAAEVKASSSKLVLRVRNTSVPNTAALIAYTAGDGTDLSAKLEIHASGNRTTLAAVNATKVFHGISDTLLNNLVPYCAFGINPGYHQVFEGDSSTPIAFDWNVVPPGCDYYIDLDGWTSTNGPTLPTASAYARVQSGHGESSWYTIRSRSIEWADGLRSFGKLETGWVYTGAAGKAGTTTVGDAAATLTPLTSTINQIWSTTLTADRAVTLSTTGAMTGDVFRISRPAAGAFNLNVGTGPLKALAAGTWCEVTYNGSAWVLTSYGAL